MSYNSDFIEGMGSAFDLNGSNYFNEFTTYPGQTESLRQHWTKVGIHLYDSVNRFTDKKDTVDQNHSGKNEDSNQNENSRKF